MKSKIKTALLILVLISVFIIVLANIGSHSVKGYTLCGGGGFVSQSSVNASIGPSGINPGGPCLGNTTAENYYGPLAVFGYNLIFGAIAVVGVVTYGLASFRYKRRQK